MCRALSGGCGLDFSSQRVTGSERPGQPPAAGTPRGPRRRTFDAEVRFQVPQPVGLAKAEPYEPTLGRLRKRALLRALAHDVTQMAEILSIPCDDRLNLSSSKGAQAE